jgi:hypothetical protein
VRESCGGSSKPAAEEITGKGLAVGRPSEADTNMDELDMNWFTQL